MQITPIIQQALADATGRGSRGKETTPFLLSRIVEITGGRSVTANIALVKNNARVAAEIAVALASHNSTQEGTS